MKNMIPRLMLGVCACVGMLVLWLGCSLQSKADASKGWPTSEGKVLECTVIEKTEKNKDDGTTSVLYSCDVVYQYSVEGRSYKSSQVSHVRSSSSSSKDAEDTARKYPVGSKVQVHYNPADPSEAVLETHTGGGSAILFLLGAVFFLVGAGGFAFSFRKAAAPAPRMRRVVRRTVPRMVRRA